MSPICSHGSGRRRGRRGKRKWSRSGAYFTLRESACGSRRSARKRGALVGPLRRRGVPNCACAPRPCKCCSTVSICAGRPFFTKDLGTILKRDAKTSKFRTAAAAVIPVSHGTPGVHFRTDFVPSEFLSRLTKIPTYWLLAGYTESLGSIPVQIEIRKGFRRDRQNQLNPPPKLWHSS